MLKWFLLQIFTKNIIKYCWYCHFTHFYFAVITVFLFFFFSGLILVSSFILVIQFTHVYMIFYTVLHVWEQNDVKNVLSTCLRLTYEPARFQIVPASRPEWWPSVVQGQSPGTHVRHVTHAPWGTRPHHASLFVFCTQYAQTQKHNHTSK